MSGNENTFLEEEEGNLHFQMPYEEISRTMFLRNGCKKDFSLGFLFTSMRVDVAFVVELFGNYSLV